MPFCALTPGAERVLDHGHLSDQIGDLDQRFLGVAPGHHDMQVFGLVL